MSFTENLSKWEDTRQKEMWELKWKPANWEDVGGDTPTNDLDTLDSKNKIDKKGKPIPTLAEMQENQKKGKEDLTQFIQNNPDAQAASETPQKTDLAKAKLDAWMNTIYP